MHCENPKITLNPPHIIDQGDESSMKMTIRKGECQKYIFLPKKDGVYERHFTIEEGGIFRGGAIIIGANMVLKMTVSIVGSDAEASLMLLGLVQGGSILEIDGVGKVSLGCENVRLRVDQTNILLGNGAKVRGRPVLEVATDSIEGGHSCRIHQISGEKFFYLQSHGIDPETAEGMLLEGEIVRHLNIVDKDNEELKGALIERVLSKSGSEK